MGTAGGEPRAWVIRHGETEWSKSGQHTGRTDPPLTARGEEQAKRLGKLVRSLLDGGEFGMVICSPMLRARRTAELARLREAGGADATVEIDGDLREWDYGEFEGLTTPEIRERHPDWSIWDGPWPGGETGPHVAARADRVVERIVSSGVDHVAVVGHGHFSRALAARWVGAGVGVGRWLDLDTASASELGWSRGERVIRRWNLVEVTA